MAGRLLRDTTIIKDDSLSIWPTIIKDDCSPIWPSGTCLNKIANDIKNISVAKVQLNLRLQNVGNIIHALTR